MIGKWGFSLLPFYLGIIPIFANNNYTLTFGDVSQQIFGDVITETCDDTAYNTEKQ